MFQTQLLLEKRKEINEVFADHGDFSVQILGLPDPIGSSRRPDVEILINLDKAKDEDIVVFVPNTSQVLGQIRAVERHDFCMDVLSKLKLLLGCSVNVVDEQALKKNYPMTYAARPNA